MKRLLSIVGFLLYCVTGWAQTLYLYPTTAVAYKGTTQTVTAIVTGVNVKTGTWSVNHGATLVGTNPGTANEPNTIGVVDATAETDTLTFTPTNGAVSPSTSSITFTASPTPVTTHPRLYIGGYGPSIASLQSKFAAGSPMATALLGPGQGFSGKDYYAELSTGGTYNSIAYNWSWTCESGTGLPSGSASPYGLVQTAYLFAYLSLINPNTSAGTNWGCYGHDVMMYIMDEFNSGLYGPGQDEFRNLSGPLTYTVDWLLGSGAISTAGDLTVARVFNANLLKYTFTSYILTWFPGATATPNSSSMFPHIWGMRNMGNNYNEARFLVLSVAPLTFNDTILDDPLMPTNGAIVVSANGGSTGWAVGDKFNIVQGSASGGVWQVVSVSTGTVTGIRPFTLGTGYATATGVATTPVSPAIGTGLTVDISSLSNTCGTARGAWCSDWTAGDTHSYFNYFVGSILYDTYAHMEDPNVSWQAYQAKYANLPTTPTCLDWQGGSEIGPDQIPCFGDGRGGESSEGNGYGFSVGSVRNGLNAIWTAGYADPLVYGPQMSLETSSWWDLHGVAAAEFLTNFNANNGPVTKSPVYSVINTGEENFYGTYPGLWGANTGTMVFDSYTGRTDRMNALEWPVLNTAFGGPDGTLAGCTFQCGIDYAMTGLFASPNDLFITQPSGSILPGPSDPRPSMPVDLWNASYNQHQMVRTGFGPSDTLMSVTCGNTLIDHEHGVCGRFEIQQGNGSLTEWITKGRMFSNNAPNAQLSSAPQSSQLAVVAGRTGCGTPSSDPDYYWSCTAGGTWGGGQQFGFALPLHSELPTYAANITDMTNVYNQMGQNGVSGASRSILFLRGSKEVVFYDRAVTLTSQDKSVYLNTTGTPTIVGNRACWPTQSGTQKACLETLLPAATNPVDIGLTPYPEADPDWEVVTTLQVDAGSTTSNQFLHHLSWGGSAYVQPVDTLVQSTAGQGSDCDLLNDGAGPLVCFERGYPTAFAITTFPASGATQIYYSDLAPKTTYPVTGTGTPATVTSDTAGVAVFAATGTGSIVLGSGVAPADPPTFSPVGGTYTGAQSVTISSTSSGAIKCYNFTGSPATNGTTGCTTGTLYTSSVSVSSSSTLYAVAGGTGYLDSALSSAPYTITTPTTATPICTPSAGTYVGTQSVTCSSTTPSSTTYCTINGSTPTTGSPVCTAISVASSLTLKAISAAAGFANSLIDSEAYTITAPAGSSVILKGLPGLEGMTIQ